MEILTVSCCLCVSERAHGAARVRSVREVECGWFKVSTLFHALTHHISHSSQASRSISPKVGALVPVTTARQFRRQQRNTTALWP